MNKHQFQHKGDSIEIAPPAKEYKPTPTKWFYRSLYDMVEEAWFDPHMVQKQRGRLRFRATEYATGKTYLVGIETTDEKTELSKIIDKALSLLISVRANG